ncbi:MAG TPA: hypothetical protein PKB10_06790, partial [Tepidisphaeraceae bacterium]|nr:hypothetical protein [Tepidisphaeraceae bacterium]
MDDPFYEMMKRVPARDWSGIEADGRVRAEQAGYVEEARQIADEDLGEYEAGFVEALQRGVRRALLHRAKSVYVEVDADNQFCTYIGVQRKRYPKRGSLDEWFQDSAEDFDGPRSDALGRYWDGEAGNVDELAAYLEARAVAAFGRAVDRVTTHGIEICLTRHDDSDGITVFAKGESRPAYHLIPREERDRIREQEAEQRAAKLLAKLSVHIDTDEQANALQALARAGAGIGGYPGSLGINYVYLEGQRDADDSVLPHLLQFPALQTLTLQRTKVTNAGLAPLMLLDNLQILDLTKTRVDDGCIDAIIRMRGLKRVNLAETGVSWRGRMRLRDARPELEIQPNRMMYEPGPVPVTLSDAEEQRMWSYMELREPVKPGRYSVRWDYFENRDLQRALSAGEPLPADATAALQAGGTYDGSDLMGLVLGGGVLASAEARRRIDAAAPGEMQWIRATINGDRSELMVGWPSLSIDCLDRARSQFKPGLVTGVQLVEPVLDKRVIGDRRVFTIAGESDA